MHVYSDLVGPPLPPLSVLSNILDPIVLDKQKSKSQTEEALIPERLKLESYS